MAIATIRNSIIVFLKADANVTALCAAANIDYGLDRDLLTSYLPKSIRVVQAGIDSEKLVSFSGTQSFEEPDAFTIIAFREFESTDTAKTVEDWASDMTYAVRNCFRKNITLGGTVRKVQIGRSLFLTHATKAKVRMILTEIMAIKRVQAA